MFFELCVQNSYDLKMKFRCVIEINAEVVVEPDDMAIGKSIHFNKRVQKSILFPYSSELCIVLRKLLHISRKHSTLTECFNRVL